MLDVRCQKSAAVRTTSTARFHFPSDTECRLHFRQRSERSEAFGQPRQGAAQGVTGAGHRKFATSFLAWSVAIDSARGASAARRSDEPHHAVSDTLLYDSQFATGLTT